MSVLRLVLDTSSKRVSLGIWTEEGWMETVTHSDLPQQQSKVLFNLIKDLLQPFGIEAKEVTEIAVGEGPGSFTGLRMGITVAKVWAYAQKIPIFTFSSKALLEKTKQSEPDAEGPDVKYLQPNDYRKVDDLAKLSPIYSNDHFAESGN